MKYVVDVNGRRVNLSLEDGGVRVGEVLHHAHLAEMTGAPVQLLTIGKKVHRVAVKRGEGRGSYTLWIGAHRYQVEALDERTRTIRDLTAASSAAQGPKPLIAPMPGLIVRIHVKPGDAVSAGDPLVGMEAMKMENELRSPSNGVVSKVLVTPGQPVEKGATLVELS